LAELKKLVDSLSDALDYVIWKRTYHFSGRKYGPDLQKLQLLRNNDHRPVSCVH